MVKMKIGTHPARRPAPRRHVRRRAIGDAATLCRRQWRLHRHSGHRACADLRRRGVSTGLKSQSAPTISPGSVKCASAPAGMDIAAGEYGYTAWYFRRMLDAQAVTVLQADARAAAASAAFSMRLRSAGRTIYRSHRTADRACIFTSAAPCRARFTWSSFTTTHASSECFSTASANRYGKHVSRSHPPGHGSRAEGEGRSVLICVLRVDHFQLIGASDRESILLRYKSLIPSKGEEYSWRSKFLILSWNG